MEDGALIGGDQLVDKDDRGRRLGDAEAAHNCTDRYRHFSFPICKFDELDTSVTPAKMIATIFVPCFMLLLAAKRFASFSGRRKLSFLWLYFALYGER